MQCIESEEKPIFYMEDENNYVKFLEIEDIINDESNWVESTCGNGSENVMDTRVRISQYYSLRPNIRVPNEVNEVLDSLSLKISGLGRFLKYEVGGLFKKHKDTRCHDMDGSIHTHYLLIYFPGDYEGGDLIIYPDKFSKREIGRVVAHEGTKYKYTLLKIGTYHESSKIIHGMKILYKIPLYTK